MIWVKGSSQDKLKSRIKEQISTLHVIKDVIHLLSWQFFKKSETRIFWNGTLWFNLVHGVSSLQGDQAT